MLAYLVASKAAEDGVYHLLEPWHFFVHEEQEQLMHQVRIA